MKKKETKYIYSTYRMDNGTWKITNNGEILRQGKGVTGWGTAEKEIEKQYNKKVVSRIMNY